MSGVPAPQAFGSPGGARSEKRDGGAAVAVRRLGFVLVTAALMGVGAWATDSSDVAALLPFFFLAVTLQFLPLFWPAEADPFSPPALAALLYGPELLGETFAAIASGTLRFPYLEDLPPAARLDLIRNALGLWIVGSAFYLAGYYLGTGRHRIARVFPQVAGLSWNRTRIQLASAVCLGIFVFTYAFFQNRIQADFTDVTALAAGKAVWRHDPSLTWLGRGILIGFIPLLFWIAAAAEKPTLRGAILIAVPTIVIALLASRLGQRSYALMFGLSVLIVIHNVYKPFKLKTLAALAIGAMIFNQIMGEWRGREIEPDAIRPSLASRIAAPDRVLSSYASDRNRIPVLATVLFYIPERQDYLLGQSFVALLAAPIPKWIWPEKVDYFKWRDSAIVGNLHGIPAPTPLPGVLYANFSWIGTAVGMFLWGLFQRGLYEWLAAHRKDRNQAMLYAAFALYFSPSSLALASALQYILPTWLIIKFVAPRSGPRPALLVARPAPSAVETAGT